MEDKVYKIKATTAQKFLKSMGKRCQPPASVFCSRELESGLNEYVRDQMAKGVPPTDEDLKAQARVILGTETTAAEDKLLLEKFKAMHGLDGQIPEISEEQILAELDAELGTMDFTQALGEIPGGEITPGMLQVEQTQLAMGVAKEYADMYRVQAATASPLRRRASEKMAETKGFSMPLPMTQQGHISPLGQSSSGSLEEQL